MNLIGMMVAVSLMSIGALITMDMLSGPPIALSRLSAQAQADGVVETMRWQAWRGKKVEPTYSPGFTEPTGLTLDGTAVTIPANCSVKSTAGNERVLIISCSGQNAAGSTSDVRFRRGSTVLIGAGAADENGCESDLFPVKCP
jgi:hypothetical protein